MCDVILEVAKIIAHERKHSTESMDCNNKKSSSKNRALMFLSTIYGNKLEWNNVGVANEFSSTEIT